jgi:hypothetical protein
VGFWESIFVTLERSQSVNIRKNPNTEVANKNKSMKFDTGSMVVL